MNLELSSTCKLLVSCSSSPGNIQQLCWLYSQRCLSHWHVRLIHLHVSPQVLTAVTRVMLSCVTVRTRLVCGHFCRQWKYLLNSLGHLFKLVSLFPRFYKGVAPLWMRQIPYTMMKFACFERTVEALYKFVVPKPRSECTKAEQLVVTFVAGYIGMTCLSICPCIYLQGLTL